MFRKRSYGRKKISSRKRYSKKTKKSALNVASKALRLAKIATNSATETKYLSFNLDSDVAGNAGVFGDEAITSLELTSVGTGWTPMFNTDGITGNKAYLKYLKGTWEIHMDNVNNEEETTNFIVAVLKPRSDYDNLVDPSNFIFNANGQTFFDPRKVKVCYYKHFTLTMGGTSLGTAGESRRYGSFYIPVNKMIRFASAATTGRQTAGPASNQDRYWFVVYTDGTAVDSENPRINGHMMSVWRDADLNH